MSEKRRRRDGTGSVYRRGDGKWVAQTRTYDPVTGVSRKVRRYATSETAAKQLLKDLLARPVPSTLPGADAAVADYLRAWMTQSLPLQGLATKTVEGYITNINVYAIPTLGRIRLGEFTPSEAEKWVGRLTRHPRKDGQPIATSTVRGTINAVSKALGTAVRDGVLVDNPLTKVARPKTARRKMPVSGATHVDTALQAAHGRRIEPLLYVVALTGCRIGEALGLRWEDIDLDTGTATFRRSGAGALTTKTDRERTVTLLPEVVEQLRVLRRRQRLDRVAMGAGWQDVDGLLFTTGTGRPLDYHNAHGELVRVLRGAGLPTARPWHSLRHGLATRLLERGVPMPMVSAMLGHANISTTVDLYGHVSPAVPVDVLTEALR